MSISRIEAMVSQKTTLTTTESYDAVFVGEFTVSSVPVKQYVTLAEPFTIFEMNLLLDYVQMSPLQALDEIFNKDKQFTVNSISSRFTTVDLAKRFVGLLLFVMDAQLKPEFTNYYYTDASNFITLVCFYTNSTQLPARPSHIKIKW